MPPPTDAADPPWAAALRGARAEAQRLAALAGLDLLDSAPEPEFEAVVAEAAAEFAVPIALVTLVDADRVWFKAARGVDVPEVPRSIAFCDRAIRGDEVMVVPDASRDPRFADNPLVTAENGLRFYAGAPLRVADSQRIGTVCVLDRVPRPDFGPERQERLTSLADRITGILTRRAAARQGGLQEGISGSSGGHRQGSPSPGPQGSG